MATTTPNFGFDIPQSTDLVKDGATAIAALGTDIDTAFVDLKGGTTGQVLSKASGTDLDFTWVAQDDSNAIQNAIVDAKGDLIAATAADTPARLAVGTNGQVLTADSTASTGVKWATPSGSSGPTFRAYRSGSNQSVSAGTWTKIQYNTENWDTDSCYDSTTNYRFTPNKAGYYQVNVAYISLGGGSGHIGFYKNGTAWVAPGQWGFGTYFAASVSELVYLNGTTDYIEAYTWNNSNGSVQTGATDSYFDAVWIRG